MLHACDQRFDVTENLENFCELNKALVAPHASQAPSALPWPACRTSYHQNPLGVGFPSLQPAMATTSRSSWPGCSFHHFEFGLAFPWCRNHVRPLCFARQPSEPPIHCHVAVPGTIVVAMRSSSVAWLPRTASRQAAAINGCAQVWACSITTSHHRRPSHPAEIGQPAMSSVFYSRPRTLSDNLEFSRGLTA